MKTCFVSLLAVIILVSACAPQSVATPSPTPVITITPPKLEPTQTLEPTPAPIPVVEISLDSCTKIVEAKISEDGILEVVFESRDTSSPNSIVSEFGSPDGGLDANLMLWNEDAQKTVAFPLPSDALGPKISPDHRWILFRRDIGVTQSEFWVTDVDGKAEKNLGTIRLDEEIKARYPDGYFSLDYGWISNTGKLFYRVEVTYGEVPPLIIDKFVMVDVNSGQAITLTIPPDTEKFEFAPDGSQIAIQSESVFRVLSTQDAREQFTIPASLNNFSYSPDGKFVIDFIDEGILRIDAEEGQQQIIPLKYTIMSSLAEGPALPPLPDFKWISASTFILASLNSDARYVFAFSKPDPNWTFTIWQVDLASGTTRPLQTFNGTPFEARFSPDMKRLAYLKHQGILPSQTRGLILADLATGEILETIQGGVFEAWFPDSSRYLYTTGISYPPPGKGDPSTSEVDIKDYLGQIGEEPILVNQSVLDLGWSSWLWADENRLVTNCKIIVVR